jgi:hypothetical protein
LWLALPLLSSLVALDTFACPTCVGPRLGDSGTGELQAHASFRSAIGTDHAGSGPERLEWSNELTAGAAWSRFELELQLPLLTRFIAGDSYIGLADLGARGSAELYRHEEPDASDTVRLGLGLGLPTSRGAQRWLTALGTQSVTPSLAIGWRHSDQEWALTGVAYGGWPIALPDAAVVFGPFVALSSAAEYQPLRWLTVRLAVDLKQQWAARESGAVVPQSQFFAVFLAPEARLRASRWFSASLGASLPIASVSPGQYVHGFVYRLGLELTI